jgi:hypothetical protein
VAVRLEQDASAAVLDGATGEVGPELVSGGVFAEGNARGRHA